MTTGTISSTPVAFATGSTIYYFAATAIDTSGQESESSMPC